MRVWTAMVCAMLGLLVAGVALAGEPMELLAAINQGKIDASFYGNGDQSVRGRIRPSAFGPDQVYVAPGTQFWAQQGGLQGMTTLGWVPIDLRNRPFAFVDIPVACTNYDLPAPSRWDRMIPYCCPSPRMAALSETVGKVIPPRPVAQLAVWAVANNPAWAQVEGYAQGHAEGEDQEALAQAVAGLRAQAAALLATAGIDPSEYRMFLTPAEAGE